MSKPEAVPGEFGWLCAYQSGALLRHATEQERDDSVEASQANGGVGAIEVDGRTCYVED